MRNFEHAGIQLVEKVEKGHEVQKLELEIFPAMLRVSTKSLRLRQK